MQGIYYPDISDPDFYNLLYSKKEFNELIPKGGDIYLETYQQFVRKFISVDTPYDSLLLYHNLGSGKTLSSISILENFHSLVGQNPGLNKFLILTKNDTLQDVFMNEILKNPNTNYLSQREKKDYKKVDQKEYIKRIRNYYQFMNYDEFTNRVIGKTVSQEFSTIKTKEIKDGQEIEDLNNRIIVVDEVQNITGNFRYLALQKALRNSKNVKLILLSATPVTNSVEEIVYLTNLLNFYNPPFNIDEEDIDINRNSAEQMTKRVRQNLEYLFESTIIKLEGEEIREEILQLSSKGIQEIKNHLKGKVSFYPLDPLNYPKVKRMGSAITNSVGSIKIVPCVMSKYQTEAYNFAKSLKQTFERKTSETATICYKADDIQDRISANKQTPLDFNNLQTYSTKLHQLLFNLDQSPGIKFIYSDYVEKSGTKLIAEVLSKNGYKPYDGSKFQEGKGSYILYGENLSKSQRANYERIINSQENMNGDLVRIIIGSPVVAEGISFLNVRQVHILEPAWNLARTFQAEGRCIRNYSHQMLPKDQRDVRVFWYSSITNDGQQTIDGLKYLAGERKDRAIKKLERILKEIAIDCRLLGQIKKNKRLQNQEAYDAYYQDYSGACDYQKCDYQCEYIDEQKIKKYKEIQEPLSYLTYGKTTDPYQIKAAKNALKVIFTKSQVWDLKGILQEIKELKLSTENIYFALEELVKNQEKILLANGNYGYLIYYKTYYRFIPLQVKQQNEYKNINTFMAQMNLETPSSGPSQTPILSSSQNPSLSQTQPPTPKIKNSVVNKIYTLEDFIQSKQDQNPKIIGLIEYNSKMDKVFKIADIKDSQTNFREQSRGRVCTTFKKDEIINLATKQGIQINSNLSKEQLCEKLMQELRDKDLILDITD